MPSVGDIIRASDVAIPAGSVIPFYNVTLSGRYPIFWGETEADTGWLVCDGGSDLHGGTVPNLTNKFIMGTNTVSGAKNTGGSTTTSSTALSGNVGATTLTISTIPSHTHAIYAESGGSTTYGNCFRTEYRNNVNMRSFSILTSTGSSGSHTHSLSTISHTHTLTPPYYTLVYCVKLP